MILKCKCNNESESKVVGKGTLHYTDGVKEHLVHDFDGFEFAWHDYNQTLVITCKDCGDLVNIDNTDNPVNHIKAANS